MADLPIISNDAQPVVLVDATDSANVAFVGSDGSQKTSLGCIAGKTNVFKVVNITTTAVTADQVILTYTVTAGKTLFLQYFTLNGQLTTTPGNANPIRLGNASFETPSGTKIFTMTDWHPAVGGPAVIAFSEPCPIAAGVVFRAVVTPASATSMIWRASFGGYER